MRSLLIALCFTAAGIGVLVTLQGLSNVLDPNPGNQRLEVGQFLIPIGATVATVALALGLVIKKRTKP